MGTPSAKAVMSSFTHPVPPSTVWASETGISTADIPCRISITQPDNSSLSFEVVTFRTNGASSLASSKPAATQRTEEILARRRRREGQTVSVIKSTTTVIQYHVRTDPAQISNNDDLPPPSHSSVPGDAEPSLNVEEGADDGQSRRHARNRGSRNRFPRRARPTSQTPYLRPPSVNIQDERDEDPLLPDEETGQDVSVVQGSGDRAPSTRTLPTESGKPRRSRRVSAASRRE